MNAIEKAIDEWAKEHRFNYDCYKEQIQDLKDRIADAGEGKDGN